MLPRSARRRLVIEHDVADAGPAQEIGDCERRLTATDNDDIDWNCR